MVTCHRYKGHQPSIGREVVAGPDCELLKAMGIEEMVDGV